MGRAPKPRPGFTLTDNHVKLLRAGAHSIAEALHNVKRPFGNSNVAGDIADIIGMERDPEEGLTEEQYDECQALWDDLGSALLVILAERDRALGPEPLPDDPEDDAPETDSAAEGATP